MFAAAQHVGQHNAEHAHDVLTKACNVLIYYKYACVNT